MYKYELHLHTNLVSRCSRFTPEEIVKLYTTLGYTGVFVTDHFINGNSGVDLTKPWVLQMYDYEQGYREVKQAARGTGLDVFFGVEYSYQGTDFLIYGLDARWFSCHPEIMDLSVKNCMQFLRDNGACVVQAHPFREAGYIDHIRLFPRCVDGVEILNVMNDMAKLYAQNYQLAPTCGTDIHRINHPAELFAFCPKTKITAETDLLGILQSGEYSLTTVANPFAEE